MSIMRRINLNVVPSGGHVFTDLDGTAHRGMSWPAVIKRLDMYRRRNRMKIGSPETEVLDQACKNHPELCLPQATRAERRMVRRGPPQIPPKKPPSLKSRVLRWLTTMRDLNEKGELRHVERAAHDERVAICKRCRLKDVLTGGCQPCEKALAGFRNEILGRRPLSGPDACSVLGEDLQTSSWLDQLTQENAALPAECWRKRTLL
jgi:hypothetical protein